MKWLIKFINLDNSHQLGHNWSRKIIIYFLNEIRSVIIKHRDSRKPWNTIKELYKFICEMILNFFLKKSMIITIINLSTPIPINTMIISSENPEIIDSKWKEVNINKLIENSSPHALNVIIAFEAIVYFLCCFWSQSWTFNSSCFNFKDYKKKKKEIYI